jgi:hypothetical protein
MKFDNKDLKEGFEGNWIKTTRDMGSILVLREKIKVLEIKGDRAIVMTEDNKKHNIKVKNIGY